MRKKLTRREFLNISASLGISLYAAAYFFADKELIAEGASTIAGSSKLCLSKGTTYSEMTKSVINKMGGIKKFVSPGDVVVLKPNIAWNQKAGYGANTTPEIVGTIAKLCKDAGAKKVKILEYPCVDPKVSFNRSGIMQVARAVGADIHYLDERTLKKCKIGGNFVTEWPVFSEFIDNDTLINIPIAKHHCLSKLSIGMKNWLGAIGDDRGELHEDLHTSIADFATFFKPDLTIVDLTKVLIKNGPQGGSLEDVKTLNMITGGLDPVATDAFAAKLLGYNPADIGFIKKAQEYGIGTMNYKKLLDS
ncbi:MAG: DUF362 domain-containing protein [Cyanobacteriota bacterium]